MKLWRYVMVTVLTMTLLLPATSHAESMPPLGLVPLRAVAEAVGSQVDWDGDTWTVTVRRGDVTMVLRIGESSVTVNGTAIPVGAPVALENGRTMIPLDFLKAMLGVEVAWDGQAPVVNESATRAMDFMRALVQGKADPTTFTPALQAVMPETRLAAIAAQLQTAGAVKQLGVQSHTKNAVHENIRFLTVFERSALDVTVRLAPSGAIDDYFMNVYAAPGPVAAVPAYADPKVFTEKDVVVGEGTPFPLPGTLSLPVGEGPYPAVVLVHGSGPNDRDESIGGVKVFRDLAQGLATRGVAVLRYEKRTREHSQKVVAGPLTLNEETVADALEAVKLLAGTAQIDPKRIFVLGHSQGGYAVPYIIQGDTEKLVAGAIVAAGPDSFLDTLVEQNKLMVEAKLLNPAQVPFVQAQVDMVRDPAFNPTQPPKGFALGMPAYWLSLRESVAPLAKQQSTPLFVFQGARDFQVPVSQFESWQQTLGDRAGVTFKLYPKLNHVFTEGEGPLGFQQEYQNPVNVPVYVVEDLVNWITTH